MLPTIHTVGDIWLIGNERWRRLLGNQSKLQIGDIVLWRNPSTGTVACKRVVGLGGDRVLRYGQFAHLYRNRGDLGVIWPRDYRSRNLDPNCDWDSEQASESCGKDWRRTITVPTGCVWLEGDCPLFSIDSRHIGPIRVEWICGRLLLRVWPLWREDENGNSIRCMVDRKRPQPLPSVDSYLGKHYNLHKITTDTCQKK